MDSGKENDNPNPRENANPISVVLFWWTIGICKRFYGRKLVEEDLYNVLGSDKSKYLGDKLETNWQENDHAPKKPNGKKSSLIKTIAITFLPELILLALLHFVNDIGVRVVLPILLQCFLQTLMSGSEAIKREAYLYSGGFITVLIIYMVVQNQKLYLANHTGMRIRIACCSLIYRKSLRLGRKALAETTTGKVVNLLSNDVSRFDTVIGDLNTLWTFPLLTVLIAYIIYSYAGYAALTGVGIVILITILQVYASKLSSTYRLKAAIKTDERMRLMNDIISGIQVIKMYVWEKPFGEMISKARNAELDMLLKSLYIHGFFTVTQFATHRLAIFGILLSMFIYGNEISSDKVFMYQLYFLQHCVLAMIFIHGLVMIAETLVSIRRLEEFLFLDERQEQSTNSSTIIQAKVTDGITLDNVTAKWNENKEECNLKNISLTVKPGSLVAVIGNVGSGKSSLLQTILGELSLCSGSLKVGGKISYACQESWVFASTVRQNILFGRPFDRIRYDKVVEVCALDRDFKELSNGDLTLVGERGSSLSGGQRARVNLARAVYNDADVYLLDDSLSALDSHVGSHIFSECLLSFLANKTRIFVSHNPQYLCDADQIVVLNEGIVEMQGTFQEVIESHAKYTRYLGLHNIEDFEETFLEEKPEAERLVFEQGRSNSLHNYKNGRKSEKSIDTEMEGTDSSKSHEISLRGKFKAVYTEYFGTNFYIQCFILILFLLGQIATNATDCWMAYWVITEDIHNYYEVKWSENKTTVNNKFVYFDAINITSRHDYIYIYSAIIVALITMLIIRTFVYYKFCNRCLHRLHNNSFDNLIHAKMTFFYLNTSGRILNRFSKDLGAVDSILPKAILETLQSILMIIGFSAVVVYINVYVLVPLIILGLILWYAARIFLGILKAVKRVEGITKSPMFTHLNATVQGITTIRANGAQEILCEEFDRHQDLHSSAWFLCITIHQVLAFFSDVLGLLLVSFVTFGFLLIENTFGGSIGLSIVQIITLLTLVVFVIRHTSDTVSQMISVERIAEYKHTPKEPILDTPQNVNLDHSWPTTGRIVFDKMYLRYGNAEESWAIKNLNLIIEPEEKVGIVGRTGAGKTSLIMSLFRLAHIDGGIYIDDIETGTIGLHDLRKRISIIPQDPVLFSGSLRRNLDPFGSYPDYMLWKVIDDVEMTNSINIHHGLDSQVSEGGSNFSVGEKQLICLARAILRNNKILILDEATANVDTQTDALIQKTIMTKFVNCTVLTVAHRLNTIMDSDKVIVMDGGVMVEFDHPHILLQNVEGYFFNLVKSMGSGMAEQFARVAEEKYLSRNKLPII